MRVLFFALSCLTVLFVCLLASSLFSSKHVGLLSAFFFLNFTAFGRFAGSGPRAKTPMLLFETIALYLAARRNWFWAGVFGSLAALTWQPTIVYPVVFLVLAILQAAPGERLRSFLRAVAGTLLPLLLISAYYVQQSAFGDLVDGLVRFNLVHLEREVIPFIQHLVGPMRVVRSGYAPVGALILIGCCAMPALYLQRLRAHDGSAVRLLRQDAFAGLLVTFPFPVLWSCVDFQGPSDFYVLLPYAALTIGWLLSLLLDAVSRITRATPSQSRLAFVLLCLVLIVLAARTYGKLSNDLLLEQRRTAQELERQLPAGATLVSVGAPQIMALLHRVNPNRYLFILNGVDNRIEALTPGGFEGWLAQLEGDRNSVIVYGGMKGRFEPRFTAWLHERWSPATVGNWHYYLPKNPEYRLERR